MKTSFFTSLVLFANIASAYHIDGYAQQKGGHDKEDQDNDNDGLIESRQFIPLEDRTFDINNNRAHREEGKGHHGLA